MEAALAAHATKGLLVPRTENNKYLKVSYRGAGKEIPATWNVKVYSSGAVVTTDETTLKMLSDGSYSLPDRRLKVLQVDDSGWGFPLCGVMVGVSDGSEIMTAVVDVRWFKKGVFESKDYLKEYSRLARDILHDHFCARPDTHRVEICTGFVNSALRDDLRSLKFDVRVAEIKGFLQDRLEASFKEYVHLALGADMAYDHKVFPDKKSLSKKYQAVLEWGEKNRPEMLKDGWRSIQKVAKKG
jgi:hypothetical protein